MNETTKKKIEDLIEKNEVCLFMKGTPEVPQCGFSLAVSNVLKHLQVRFIGINVLEDLLKKNPNPAEEEILNAILTGWHRGDW